MKIWTLDGSEPEWEVPSIATASRPRSWTSDGTALLVNELGAETASDVWLLPLDGREARPVAASARRDSGGQASPNGRWVAYYSEEKGAGQVFVTPLQQPGPHWQVSFEGGTQPRWSRDGRFLYYVWNGIAAGDQAQQSELVAVPVDDAGPEPRFGAPRTLFHGFLQSTADRWVYAAHPDGRLLVIKRESQDTGVDRSHAILVLGWRDELARRMAGGEH